MQLDKTQPVVQEHNNWSIIIMAVIAGILATMNLSKITALSTFISSSLSLSKLDVSYIQSCFNLMTIFFAIAASFLSRIVSPFKLLYLGLILLAGANFCGALTEVPVYFVLARIIEGTGFLLIAINAPVCISLSSNHNTKTTALTLWSIYVPTGVALGLLCAPLLATQFHHWQAIWYVSGILSLILLLMLLLTKKPSITTPIKPLHSANNENYARQTSFWLFAVAAFVYTFMFFVIMPTIGHYLSGYYKLSSANTAVISAIIIASNIPGNLLAGKLVQKYSRQSIINGAMLFMGLGGVYCFSFTHSLSAFIMINCLIVAVGGLVPSIVLSSAVHFSHHRSAIATMQAIFLTGLNLGQFVGPISTGYILLNGNDKLVGRLFLISVVFLILVKIISQKKKVVQHTA